MNGYDYKLKEQQVNNLANLSSIAGSLDDMRAEFQKTNIPVELSGITNSLDNLATQTFELNKTMEGIASSLRVIAVNTK
jgi:hypothetical protein